MKIKYTKNGQPYIITASGKAKFIKKGSKKKYSTIKVRRVQSMRRKSRGYRKSSSKSMLGINGNDIWKGVGAGSAGLVGGIMNQFVPQLPSNLATGAAGIALCYIGKGPVKQIGKGIVIKTIGDLIEDNVVPMISGQLGIGSKSTTTAPNNAVIYG